MKPVMRFLFKYIIMDFMKLLGQMHSLETGAKRYVDVLLNSKFQSGKFYASKKSGMTGELVDQGTVFDLISNEKAQDNAYSVVQNLAEATDKHSAGAREKVTSV
jgi:hypothetical protein